ncbi:MAG: DUF2085 domain-containing protein [Promethearchaeota archaeon]
MNIKEFIFLLLAHHSRDNLSHTIRIPIGKRNIYLCARCTSIYSALIVSLLLFTYIINLRMFPVWGISILAYIFGIPVILSWSKQTFTGHENSNTTRILTGLGGGIGLAILFFLPTPIREFSIFGILGVVFLILYFGKIRRCKKEYLEYQKKNNSI